MPTIQQDTKQAYNSSIGIKNLGLAGPGPRQSELDLLNTTIERLDKTISDLQEVLIPVMMPENQCNAAPEGADYPTDTPFNQKIRDCRLILDAQIARLLGFRRRIQY